MHTTYARLWLRNAGAVLSISAAAFGCGAGVEEPVSVDDTAVFAPYPDMDQGAIARRISAPPPSLASSKVGQLDVAPDGSIRLWRRGEPGNPYRRFLERYAPDGRREARRDFSEEARVVFHPDGQLTVVTPLGGSTQYARLSSEFTETARVTVANPDAAMVELPTFYRVADDGTFAVEVSDQAVAPRLASLVADRDGGFYGVERFQNPSGYRGARLVRFDANHTAVAMTWLLPGAELPIQWQGTPVEIDGKVVVPILRYHFGDPQLVVDHQRRVWVLSGAHGASSAALSEFFGRPIDLRDAGDLFVLRFSAALELEAVISVPAPNAQSFALLAEGTGGAIGLAAFSDETREIGPNKSFNYNAFFAGLDRDATLVGQRELDLDRDEWPYALAACATGFCIAGETGTTWVNTGSQIDVAQGFVLAVGIDGSPVTQSTLRGPRHNSIEALATRDDGSVVFAGTTDGPITHSDPAEWSSTALLGVLQL